MSDPNLSYQVRVAGLGAKIKSERLKAGLTTGELASVLNLGSTWLWQVENGVYKVGLEQVPLLEEALNTKLIDRNELAENLLSIAEVPNNDCHNPPVFHKRRFRQNSQA
jgi:transcriptional regulator with XRE-family HTH domain